MLAGKGWSREGSLGCTVEAGYLDGILARGAGKGAGAGCAEGKAPDTVTP